MIEAYREKRWNPEPEKFEQCRRENYVDKEGEAKKLALNEGCQIYGAIEVNRVSTTACDPRITRTFVISDRVSKRKHLSAAPVQFGDLCPWHMCHIPEVIDRCELSSNSDDKSKFTWLCRSRCYSDVFVNWSGFKRILTKCYCICLCVRRWVDHSMWRPAKVSPSITFTFTMCILIRRRHSIYRMWCGIYRLANASISQTRIHWTAWK